MSVSVPHPVHGERTERTYDFSVLSSVLECPMAPTFEALVRDVIARLSSSTICIIRELEAAVVVRRTELESCVVPILVAERPAVGEAFEDIVRDLIARLPSSTTSQLSIILELGAAVVGRRTELESCVVLVAERPAVGETHPRDEPPPLPRLQPVQRPPCALVVRPPHGKVTHVAGEEYDHIGGEEYCHRDGPALAARFLCIGGIVSASDGKLYVSDSFNHRIRKLHDGVVSTFTGTGEEGFQEGDSDIAQFSYCRGAALHNQGRLLVVSGQHIRAIAPNGRTTTLARLRHTPNHVFAAPDGSIFVSEESSIRNISTDGIVTMITMIDTRFDDLQGMALAASGTLIVCDVLNNRLRRVNPNNGHVTTIDPVIVHPYGVSCSSDGTLYVASRGGLYEINNNEVSQLAPNLGPVLCCHLDEPNGLIYIGTETKIFTISVPSFGERRATRIFPLVRIWALV